MVAHFKLPDGRIIDSVCDLKGLKNRLAQFPISKNLAGKRVLDGAAWDDWFSFEMERRGSEVTAVDCWGNEPCSPPVLLQRVRGVLPRIGIRSMNVWAPLVGAAGRPPPQRIHWRNELGDCARQIPAIQGLKALTRSAESPFREFP